MAVIKQSIIDALNYRIEQEEMSSRLYKAMSLYLNKQGYLGAAALWEKYSKEESGHADWAYNYLLKLNVLPDVPSLDSPQSSFKGLPNIIALSYKHEVEILEQLQDFAKLCYDENDFMTLELAQMYLKEQAEEIEKITTLVDMLEAFGDSKEFLRLFDNELKGML